MTIQAGFAEVEAPGPRRSARRTTLVVLAYLLVIAAGALIPLANVSSVTPPAPYVTPARQVALFVQYLVWVVPLLVAMDRNPIGRFWKLIFTYVVTAQVYVLAYTGIPLLWSLAALLENVAIGLLLHLLLTFPSGHLRDRFDRAVIGATYGYIVVFQALEMTTRDVDPLNLLAGGDPAAADLTPILPVVQWCVPVLGFLVGVAMWRHWRDASQAARRGLLPIVVALPLVLLGVTISVLARSYGIRPVVDFFDYGGVVVLGFLFPVAFSLGVLRLRFRRGRVADLVVALGRGVPLGGLRDVLARALDDQTMELAFAAPSGDGFVDAEGLPVAFPLPGRSRSVTRVERDGELLGVLMHDPAVEADDPGLVEAVGNAAALAIANESLAAQVRAQLEDVRASRARLVDAADAERRRVERDLHDGAQQRLVALALRLQLAKETAVGASDVLDEATAELQVAIGEVRGLARGLHPTILTEVGLAAALEALAERAPLPVTVHAPDGRHEPVVDATAYFVAAESLTNIARHAGATQAHVTVVDDGDHLVLTVVDDGLGGADPATGTGLRGLADRLAAVEGRLTISSPPGGGTTVRADLPLHPHAGIDATTSAATGQARWPAGSAPGLGLKRWRPIPRQNGRGRFPEPVALTMLAAIVLAVVVVGAVTLGPRPAETWVLQRDDSFARPFDYLVPPGTSLALDPKSGTLHVLGTRGGDVAEGMSFWLVTDGLADPCQPGGRRSMLQQGPDGVMAYLRTVDGLEFGRQMDLTIDGRPAMRLDLNVGPGHDACTFEEELGFVGLSLWRDVGSPDGDWMFVPQGRPVPLTVLEVEGAMVVIETWSYADIEAWRPTAERIIASIRFHHGAGHDLTSSGPSPE